MAEPKDARLVRTQPLRSFLGGLDLSALVYSPEKEKTPLKRFLKSRWFRVLYVFLIALASSVVTVSAGCLATFFMPLLMFAVPYYLKERNIKRYLMNGVAVFLISLVLVNLFFTALTMASPEQEMSAQSGNVRLDHGTVDPYAGPAGSSYNYSVVYVNTDPVDRSDVWLTLRVFDAVTTKTSTFNISSNISSAAPPSASDGWTYYMHLTLTEGIYFYNFTANTAYNSIQTEVSTPLGFGPIDASWTTFSSVIALAILVQLLFPFTLYLIIIGMYWWAGKARTMRGSTRVPSDAGEGGFECTNCGAEVSASATKCHRCGAIFEEEEHAVRAKKVEKGRESETEGKSAATKKEGGK